MKPKNKFNKFEGKRDKFSSGFNKRFDDREVKKFNVRIISEIINLKDGDFFRGNVKILRKSQPGPVIFTISDGYASVDAVTKESSFNEGEIVELEGEVKERAGRLQVEIESIKKSDFDFAKIIEKNSNPKEIPFSIKSDRLEKLRPRFIAIAKRIRRAVLENQSILIRHHADSDGINAGIAIEQACSMLMKEVGINADYNLYRSPSKAPFYEITDVLRDIVFTKRLLESHGQKKPLILVLDNGSTPEDVLGLKTLNSLGFEVIVVDHHNPVVIKDKKTAVDPYLSLHLNPYIEGLDSQTSAGMLAYELARLIYSEYKNQSLPAVAAISDRCDIKETEEYIKNSGRTRQELEKMGIAIDFLAYHLRFDSGETIFEEVYNNKEFVDIIVEEVKQGVETQLQSTLPYLRSQDIEGVIFSYIDLEKYTLRFTYPNPGKVIGLIHDQVASKNEGKPVITLGCLSEMVIVRATKPILPVDKPILPVDKIIKKLKKDIPQANVSGGGHECAGAIKFVSAHFTEILENIKQQVKDLNYLANSPDEERCDL